MKCAPTRPSRQQQGATWTQDGLHVCHGATPIWDVFHHLSRDNNIKGILAEVRCKILDIANNIHAWPRDDIYTHVRGGTAFPHQITNGSIHVIRAHLKNPHACQADGFDLRPNKVNAVSRAHSTLRSDRGRQVHNGCRRVIPLRWCIPTTEKAGEDSLGRSVTHQT